MDLIFRRYFWVVNLAIVGLCAALIGRAASHVVEGAYLVGDDPKGPGMQPGFRRQASPPPVTKSHAKDTDDIVARNVFCAGCVKAAPAPVDGGTTGTTDAGPTKTALPLELVSTMVCVEDPRWSMAVIRDTSTKEKDSEMFNQGKKVFTTSAVVKLVVHKRVYFDNGGHTEFLDLDGAGPAAPVVAAAAPATPPPGGAELGEFDKQIACTGGNCTVERALVEKMLGNTAALASMARFVPSVKDGKPNGFKVYAIRPNSVFAKIGLQNGDTMKQINGQEMSTPDQALSLYTKLRSASHLTMQVERRGETVTMDYTIK